MVAISRQGSNSMNEGTMDPEDDLLAVSNATLEILENQVDGLAMMAQGHNEALKILAKRIDELVAILKEMFEAMNKVPSPEVMQKLGHPS